MIVNEKKMREKIMKVDEWCDRWV